MNLLILRPEQLTGENQAIISDRPLKHMLEVQQIREGDTLKAGVLNGNIGTATVLSLSATEARLLLQLDRPPPPAVRITAVVALPRPKVLKRMLQTLTTLGIKKILLINSYRVEKSYWQSPLLDPDEVERQLILGLEQARDTLLPEVILEKRFKPFAEDRLPSLLAGNQGLVAHPGSEQLPPLSNPDNLHRVIVIGPEGGFIPYEIEILKNAGCEIVSLGLRILKVETAITSLVTQISR